MLIDSSLLCCSAILSWRYLIKQPLNKLHFKYYPQIYAHECFLLLVWLLCPLLEMWNYTWTLFSSSTLRLAHSSSMKYKNLRSGVHRLRNAISQQSACRGCSASLEWPPAWQNFSPQVSIGHRSPFHCLKCGGGRQHARYWSSFPFIPRVFIWKVYVFCLNFPHICFMDFVHLANSWGK